jgi:hypothetical protein
VTATTTRADDAVSLMTAGGAHIDQLTSMRALQVQVHVNASNRDSDQCQSNKLREAATARRAAAQISIQIHRQGLERDAADLERQAEALESEEAPKGKQNDGGAA